MSSSDSRNSDASVKSIGWPEAIDDRALTCSSGVNVWKSAVGKLGKITLTT